MNLSKRIEFLTCLNPLFTGLGQNDNDSLVHAIVGIRPSAR